MHKCQSASFGRAATRSTQGNSPPTVGPVNYASKHRDRKTSHGLFHSLLLTEQNSSGFTQRRGGIEKPKKKREREQELSLLIKAAAFSISRSESPVTKHSTLLYALLSEHLTSHQPLSSFNDSFSISFSFTRSRSFSLSLPPMPSLVARMDGLLDDSLILMQHLRSGRAGASAAKCHISSD